MGRIFLRVEVKNAKGVHARAASSIVQACLAVSGDIELWWKPRILLEDSGICAGEYTMANPRSIMALLTCAILRGDVFYLCLRGREGAELEADELKGRLESGGSSDLETGITVIDEQQLPEQLRKVLA